MDDNNDNNIIKCITKIEYKLVNFGCTILMQVLPLSVRGAVLGFASLSTKRKHAMYITFGSTSLGIPSALARVFQRVSLCL